MLVSETVPRVGLIEYNVLPGSSIRICTPPHPPKHPEGSVEQNLGLPEIVDLLGPGGPCGPQNYSKRWGASSLTFWNGCWCGSGFWLL